MQIIVTNFISLDGVTQAPGGPEEDTDNGFAHGGWSHPYMDPDVMGPVIGELMERSDALLYGRRTWQGMAAAWPGRAGDPFADQMNAIKKYVASRTLSQDDLVWENSELLDPADAVGAIAKLREQDGGALQIWGSATLTSQLIDAGLVDEYILFIEPVLLGGGKSAFPTTGSKHPLELVSATPCGTGTIVAIYKPAA